jgi:hypothetical protein
MIGDVAQCARKGCDITYVKKTHNMKYHDAECCRVATNEKIMEKYYDRRARKLGIARHCTGCQGKLSMYNSETICNSCSKKQENNRNNAISEMMLSVLWVE